MVFLRGLLLSFNLVIEYSNWDFSTKFDSESCISLIVWVSFLGIVFAFIPNMKELEVRDGVKSFKERGNFGKGRNRTESLNLMVGIAKRISNNWET